MIKELNVVKKLNEKDKLCEAGMSMYISNPQNKLNCSYLINQYCTCRTTQIFS